MLRVILFIYVSSYIIGVKSYVYIKVKKENDSGLDVEAVIHKKISKTSLDDYKQQKLRKDTNTAVKRSAEHDFDIIEANYKNSDKIRSGIKQYSIIQTTGKYSDVSSDIIERQYKNIGKNRNFETFLFDNDNDDIINTYYRNSDRVRTSINTENIQPLIKKHPVSDFGPDGQVAPKKRIGLKKHPVARVPDAENKIGKQLLPKELVVVKKHVAAKGPLDVKQGNDIKQNLAPRKNQVSKKHNLDDTKESEKDNITPKHEIADGLVILNEHISSKEHKNPKKHVHPKDHLRPKQHLITIEHLELKEHLDSKEDLNVKDPVEQKHQKPKKRLPKERLAPKMYQPHPEHRDRNKHSEKHLDPTNPDSKEQSDHKVHFIIKERKDRQKQPKEKQSLQHIVLNKHVPNQNVSKKHLHKKHLEPNELSDEHLELKNLSPDRINAKKPVSTDPDSLKQHLGPKEPYSLTSRLPKHGSSDLKSPGHHVIGTRDQAGLRNLISLTDPKQASNILSLNKFIDKTIERTILDVIKQPDSHFGKKTTLVHLSDKDPKPWVMMKLDSNIILNMLSDALMRDRSSKSFATLTREAASDINS